MASVRAPPDGNGNDRPFGAAFGAAAGAVEARPGGLAVANAWAAESEGLAPAADAAPAI
jgi:hypothetical protein